jgi:hypothetical protein
MSIEDCRENDLRVAAEIGTMKASLHLRSQPCRGLFQGGGEFGMFKVRP